MDQVVTWAQIFTAIGTVVAAFAAVRAANAARNQVQTSRDAMADQHRLLSEDLKIRVLLQFEDRFESERMHLARAQLARLLHGTGVYQKKGPIPDSVYAAIRDDVPGFFESLGAMLKRKHLDIDLVYVYFDHYARHYWAALPSYIERDRKENGDDVWEEFEVLVKALRAHYRTLYHKDIEEPDADDLKRFLEDEIQYAPLRVP